jgi:copper(I)-binding protein
VIRSSSGRTVARRTLIGAMALLIPALAGCEAGLNAPTLQFHEVPSGAHAVYNGITINNAFVLGAPSGSTVPSGGSASMFMSLFNGGTTSDQLVGVSAPGTAGSVKVTNGAISLPVSSPVNLEGPHPAIILSNLSKTLSSGGSIPVTLDFKHAGSVTLNVPVQPQSFYFATFSAPPSPGASPTATPKKQPPASPTPARKSAGAGNGVGPTSGQQAP